MSRVGKYPVNIPAGVTVNLNGLNVKVKGKLGELEYTASDDVNLKLEDNKLWVIPVASETGINRATWGTARARINNLVKGVTEGFSKKLEINGVGYKAAVQGKILKLSLGFSHDVDFEIPAGLKVACATPTNVEITGVDKQVVGQFAAVVRAKRPPEPYKGKGIKYEGEYIIRKEGKKK
ncbi:MAG: 50S ribosomal protein L6 [Alphaproteobacteria bacterium]|nr:50S ribosomal protein L6 [Alphaproteobacteria bacterium]